MCIYFLSGGFLSSSILFNCRRYSKQLAYLGDSDGFLMVMRVIMELNEKEDFCVFDDTNQTFLQLNCLNKCVLL